MVSEKALVLPISADQIDDLLRAEKPSGWLLSASASRIASIIILQQLPSLMQKTESPERLMSSALSDLMKGTQKPSDLQYLRTMASKSFDRKKLKEAMSLLPDSGVSLCDPEDLRYTQPTRADGSLNPGFSEEILSRRSPSSFSSLDPQLSKLGLNDPQGRAVNRIVSEPDEHIHIQGYPGAGKSYLIQTLTTVLPARKTLILAMTKSQLDGLFARVSSDEVVGKTFSRMAADIITDMSLPGQWRESRRSYQSYNVSGQQIADHLGFRSIRNLSPDVVADICRRTVMSYCHTPHTHIGDHHLPVIRDRLDRVDKAALIQYAQYFWEQTIAPEKGTDFLPLRGYHLIKLVALKQWAIPDRFSHVIIDEAHDLSGPMIQILDRSAGCVITLGDKFQRLEGKAPERKGSIRRNDLDLTMRAGREMESLINPMIEAHPQAKDESPLRATDRVETVCNYYDRPSIPEHPCTILVGGEWQLFEYFQRLSHEGVKFALLPGAYTQFKSFAEGLVDLFHDGKRAKNSFLFRYPDWNSLQQASHRIKAFQRIEAMLRKGYTRTQLDASLMSIVPLSKAKYLLGRVDDARNLEFQSVMLTPELIPTGATLKNNDYLSTAISRLYVGASRAQNRIIVPGYLRGWLQDQKN